MDAVQIETASSRIVKIRNSCEARFRGALYAEQAGPGRSL